MDDNNDTCSSEDLTEHMKWTMLSAIGGRMLEFKEGYARGELPLSETVMQPTKVFHDGAILALADEVASTAIYGGPVELESIGQKPFPYSIQINVNLLTNDPVGPLTAESQVVRTGRVTVVDTVVYTAGGEKAALVRSTHMMVDLNKKGPHKADLTVQK